MYNQNSEATTDRFTHSEHHADFGAIPHYNLNYHHHQHSKYETQEDLVQTLLYPDPNPQDQSPASSTDQTKTTCRKGFECLDVFENLILHRRPENSIELSPEPRLLAYAQYDIVNSDGRQLYIAVEKTTHKSIFWTRDARLFNVTMYDHSCNKILTVERKWSLSYHFAQYFCLCCTFGFKGYGNKAVVSLCEGDRRLGHISQRFSCNQTILDIHDENGKCILCIFGALIDGIFDIFFADEDDTPIAMIETSMTSNEVLDFYGVSVSEYEDPYGITFFSPKITPDEKALIISAVILMDYVFCKPNTDYPHWVQFLPIDFKQENSTHQKVFRDGSKEIIVTSLKPVITRRNILRNHSRLGCCRWFCGLICLCCPLGMARNALRCTHLLIFAIVIAFLLTFLIVCHVVRII